MKTQIFLDSADPEETGQADTILKSGGFPGVEGQTTNPSLISKLFKERVKERARKKEFLDFYHKTVSEISQTTGGPISIQVIADSLTTKEDMLEQARIYKSWIPSGVVKFPCNDVGLSAASEFCREWSVNITLNFSQDQAAAVYQATQNAKFKVFISPFVGRLDDRGENGMDTVKNILEMYNSPVGEGDGHVRVLTASVRTIEHLLYAIYLKSPAITIPFKVLKMWQETGFQLPDDSYTYSHGYLSRIEYKKLTLDQDWHSYDLQHELTDLGIKKFYEDWKSIIL